MRKEPEVIHVPDKARTRIGIEPNLYASIREVAHGRSPWPLYLHGPAGVGKSCAGLMLLDYCCGFNEYWTLLGLRNELIDADKGRVWTGGISPTQVSPRTIRHSIRLGQLVVLDEVGSTQQGVTNFHYDTLKEVLDVREGKPLVLLSNRGPAELERIYDDPVASRCKAGTTLDLTNYPDLRLRKQGST